MISDKDFLKFINDKDSVLTKEEIESIIDKELEKSEENMDTDLIEHCLDTLDEMNKTKGYVDIKEKVGDTNGKHIKLSFKRIAAIAAVVALIFVGGVSVSALVLNVNIFDRMIEFYEDYIRIRFDKSDSGASEYKLLGTELAKELANNSIAPVLLPEALLSDDCEILSVICEDFNAVITAKVSFRCGKDDGYMSIDHFLTKDAISHADYPDTDDRIEAIVVSGVTVYIIEQNGDGTIVYQDGQTEYTIVTGLSFEKAVEFANTIK